MASLFEMLAKEIERGEFRPHPDPKKNVGLRKRPMNSNNINRKKSLQHTHTNNCIDTRFYFICCFSFFHYFVTGLFAVATNARNVYSFFMRTKQFNIYSGLHRIYLIPFSFDPRSFFLSLRWLSKGSVGFRRIRDSQTKQTLPKKKTNNLNGMMIMWNNNGCGLWPKSNHHQQRWQRHGKNPMSSSSPVPLYHETISRSAKNPWVTQSPSQFNRWAKRTHKIGSKGWNYRTCAVHAG